MVRIEESSRWKPESDSKMPRKPTDKVIEHRISLSSLERTYLDQYLKQHKASMWVNAVSGSTGPLLIGVAALGAVGVLSLWKAPQLKEIVSSTLDDVFTTLTDPHTYTRSPLTSVQIIRFRIEAKEFADERNSLNRERAAYCTISADSFDEAKCRMVDPKFEDWKERLTAFQAMVYRELEDQKDRDMVFGGLGTVNPRADNNPYNDENPEVTSYLDSIPTSASINQDAVTTEFCLQNNVATPKNGDRHQWTFTAEDSAGGTVWTGNLGYWEGMWWIPDDFDDLYVRRSGGGRRDDGEGGSEDTGDDREYTDIARPREGDGSKPSRAESGGGSGRGRRQ